MGYHCPDRQTTADFLTSLTNPEERIVQQGFEEKVPRTAAEFASAWLNSPERAELLKEIASFEERFPLEGQQLEHFKRSRRAQQAPLM
jgi:antibiotic biosynthesis monooxygenase (ABM) superfamily enzyme